MVIKIKTYKSYIFHQNSGESFVTVALDDPSCLSFSAGSLANCLSVCIGFLHSPLRSSEHRSQPELSAGKSALNAESASELELVPPTQVTEQLFKEPVFSHRSFLS